MCTERPSALCTWGHEARAIVGAVQPCVYLRIKKVSTTMVAFQPCFTDVSPAVGFEHRRTTATRRTSS